jgi:hypothetical protein
MIALLQRNISKMLFLSLESVAFDVRSRIPCLVSLIIASIKGHGPGRASLPSKAMEAIMEDTSQTRYSRSGLDHEP